MKKHYMHGHNHTKRFIVVYHLVKYISVMQSKNIRSIILVIDQNVGAINLVPEENGSIRLANLDLNSYTSKTISRLSNAGIKIMLLPPKEIASDNS